MLKFSILLIVLLLSATAILNHLRSARLDALIDGGMPIMEALQDSSYFQLAEPFSMVSTALGLALLWSLLLVLRAIRRAMQ